MSRCWELAKRPYAPKATIETRIEQLYSDLDRAKQLAFDARASTDDGLDDYAKPDLQNLAKILELQAKCFGVIGADGRNRNPPDGSISVPIDEAERLVAAAKLRLKEQEKNVES